MLRNVARSLKPGGPVFIVGNMLDDSRLLPPVLVGQNLVFINIYDDGLIYTEGEYRALLADAGFVDVVVQQAGMPGGQALISARKPNRAAMTPSHIMTLDLSDEETAALLGEPTALSTAIDTRSRDASGP